MRLGTRLHRASPRLLRTLLISYVIVLAIPILFGGVTHLLTIDAVEEQAQKVNMALLAQVSHSVDARLVEVRRTALQISLDYTIQGFYSRTPALTETDRYDITRIMRDLHPYTDDQESFEELFVYYRNSDRIVTASGMYEPEFFYEHIYSYPDMDFDRWHDSILGSIHFDTYLPAVDMRRGIWPVRMITYLQTIPYTSLKNPAALVCIYLAEGTIVGPLSDIAVFGSAFVIDTDNQVIAGVGDGNPPDVSLLRGREGMATLGRGRKEVVVSYTSSSVTGWKYLTVVPKDVIRAPANRIRTITMILVGICCGVGMVFAYILARRNYAPIRGLVTTLSGLLPQGVQTQTDELKLIGDTVSWVVDRNTELARELDSVLGENKQFRDRIAATWPVARNALITRMVTNRAGEALGIWLASYGIEFPHRLFSVVVLSGEERAGEIEIPQSEERQRTIRYLILTSVERAATGETSRGYAAELADGTIVLIVNFDESDATRSHGLVQQIAADAERLAHLSAGLSLRVGVGTIETGTQRVPRSFQRALRDASASQSTVTTMSPAVEDLSREDHGFYYPIETERRLLAYMRAGSFEHCREVLHAVFEQNFARHHLPAALARCILFDIMSTALKLLEELGVDYVELFGDSADPIERLTAYESVQDTYDEILEVYRRVCGFVGERQVRTNDDLARSVLAEIESQYQNPGLSQTMLAEQFGVTAPYLSTFFREHTGRSMVDYVNDLRIEKAKELLRSSRMSVISIARTVGFGTDKTLFRVFKKREGITPGRYRDVFTP